MLRIDQTTSLRPRKKKLSSQLPKVTSTTKFPCRTIFQPCCVCLCMATWIIWCCWLFIDWTVFLCPFHRDFMQRTNYVLMNDGREIRIWSRRRFKLKRISLNVNSVPSGTRSVSLVWVILYHISDVIHNSCSEMASASRFPAHLRDVPSARPLKDYEEM